jgi:hypothetical protein
MDDGWQAMCYACNTGNITNVTIKVKRNFKKMKIDLDDGFRSEFVHCASRIGIRSAWPGTMMYQDPETQAEACGYRRKPSIVNQQPEIDSCIGHCM